MDVVNVLSLYFAVATRHLSFKVGGSALVGVGSTALSTSAETTTTWHGIFAFWRLGTVASPS
jgi:hypothetical protein